MILTGEQIKSQLGKGIVIEPFEPQMVNPNSVNLRLHDELLEYEELVLDMKRPSRMQRLSIPPDGLVLGANQLYLGRTVEWIESRRFVPVVHARASVARLGLFVQTSAGIGDIGYRGYWTLVLYPTQPVRVYPGVPICQVSFHEPAGPIVEYNSDKYQDSRDIKPSMLFRELSPSGDSQLRLQFGQEGPS